MEALNSMSILFVPKVHIRETLQHLQEAGYRESECVVLWIGRRTGSNIKVERTYCPEQYAGADYFEIPPESMQAVFAELLPTRSIIVAQVHSHPNEAFHSVADDTWAIIRHEGALSLVLPHFALGTSLNTFSRDTVVFRLNDKNEWSEIPAAECNEHIIVTNE
jgi:proteasome lid subunit RPN8/RPN11